MNKRVAAEAIQVIRTERDARAARLSAQSSNYADDQWLFTEEPFINDLCLTVLVAVFHQVERDLIHLAARVSADGTDLTADQYEERVVEARRIFRNRRAQFISVLSLDALEDWHAMETLRLLANCHKHDPGGSPDPLLLGHLSLDASVSYAALPESDAVRMALATSIGLSEEADFCAIADAFLLQAERFVAAAAAAQPTLSRVRRGSVSFHWSRLLR